MIFSSISFIYYFLPILLLIYFLASKKYKNLVLLVASLVFYTLGEPKYVIVFIASILINYYLGLLVEKNLKNNKAKKYLISAIIIDLGILFFFKYTNFFIQNINAIFSSKVGLLSLTLPIGISFFTFQTMSYVIDVYNKKVKADHNLISFATYVALFPQLIAGPIVRYSDINEFLKKRDSNYDDFGYGVKRFVGGLAKKVLIANVFGQLCNIIGNFNEMTILASWIKAISYTLQIYFDFSGYSDMAIGLGRIFGFKFLENFNYPFIATSITDFWRRWHISLSSWLRDYIYIPLGGNRVSKIKWIRNIFIVWFATGFWHGASWNFIIWGLYFAVFLLLEKMFLQKFLDKHKIIGHVYTMFIVIISFVIFNYDNMDILVLNLKNMFAFNKLSFYNQEILYYLKSYLILFMIAIVASTPLFKNLQIRMSERSKFKKVLLFIEPIVVIAILLLVTAYLIDSSFNPFLYFRF